MLMVRARGSSLTATDDGLSGQLVLATRSSLLPSITSPSIFQNDLADDGISQHHALASKRSSARSKHPHPKLCYVGLGRHAWTMGAPRNNLSHTVVPVKFTVAQNLFGAAARNHLPFLLFAPARVRTPQDHQTSHSDAWRRGAGIARRHGVWDLRARRRARRRSPSAAQEPPQDGR